MMALKCDICKSYYDFSHSDVRSIVLLDGLGGKKKKYDICPECLAAVMSTLNDRKVVEIKKEGRHD
jgi:hypothetical protein